MLNTPSYLNETIKYTNQPQYYILMNCKYFKLLQYASIHCNKHSRIIFYININIPLRI